MSREGPAGGHRGVGRESRSPRPPVGQAQRQRGHGQEEEHGQVAELVVARPEVDDQGAEEEQDEPAEAAVPISGTAKPTSNPSAPAALRTPSGIIHDRGTRPRSITAATRSWRTRSI